MSSTGPPEAFTYLPTYLLLRSFTRLLPHTLPCLGTLVLVPRSLRVDRGRDHKSLTRLSVQGTTPRTALHFTHLPDSSVRVLPDGLARGRSDEGPVPECPSGCDWALRRRTSCRVRGDPRPHVGTGEGRGPVTYTVGVRRS